MVENQQAAQRAWEAERLGGRRYTARTAGVEPLIEAQGLFCVAIYQRMEYHRDLRQRFRFECRGGVWLPGKRPPQNGHEAAYFTQTIHLYDFFTRIFLAGVEAVDVTRRDDPGCFTAATAAMRAVLLEDLPDIFARGLDSPYEFERIGAALSMAGKVRPAIRMYPSVRKALGESGEPRTVLLGRLPADVLEAHRAGARGVSELLQGVRRLVGQTRQTLAKRVIRPLPEPMLERLEGQPHHTPYAVNELEEWYAKQERLQDLNKRILRAGLSRRQEEVLALRRAGYSHADIAAQLGISLGAVKQHAFRGSGKISNADGA